jgi:hypothetical protein
MKKILLSTILLACLSCIRKDDLPEVSVVNTSSNTSPSIIPVGGEMVPKTITTTYNRDQPTIFYTKLTYSDEGKLLSSKNQLGELTNYTYQGDLIVSVKDSYTHTNYAYNQNSKIAKITTENKDGSREINYSYDDSNKLISVVSCFSGTTLATINGPMVKTKYKATSIYEYTYNTNSTVSLKKTSLTEYPGKPVITDSVTSSILSFDNKGNVIAYEGANGRKTCYTFDDKKRTLLNIKGFDVTLIDDYYFPGFINVNNLISKKVTPQHVADPLESIDITHDTKDRAVKFIEKKDGVWDVTVEYTY